MPDYNQFRERRRPVADPHEQAEHQRQARLVRIRLDDLERSDEWAIFVKHVEGLKEQADAAIAAYQARMEDAVGATHMRLRLALRSLQGARSAYEEVLRIPVMIREQVHST